LEEILINQIVIQKILNYQVEGVTGKHYQWYNYNDKKLEALIDGSGGFRVLFQAKIISKIHKLG